MTSGKTSLEIAEDCLTVIQAAPVAFLFDNIKQVIAGTVEETRAERVPVGIIHKGREKVMINPLSVLHACLNEAYRIHCTDNIFFIPSFQREAIAAVDELIALNDFSKLTLAEAATLLQERVKNKKT